MAAEDYLYPDYWGEAEPLEEQHYKSIPNLTTESVLNRNTWIDANGVIHNVEDMGEDYLKNVLHFVYKRRDYYWLNCTNINLVNKFKNGDEFFQKVIRKSTLWNSIINELQKPNEGFNFTFETPGEDDLNE